MKPSRKSIILSALAAATLPAAAAPGSSDTAFNTTGFATASYGGTESGNAVAIAPDGKIVVVGSTNTLGHNDIAVLRYNPNGTLDTTFSSDGGVITDIGVGSEDFGTAVAVQANGKILVAGYSNVNDLNDFVVLRYNVDGSLDTFFGGGGKITTDFFNDDRATSIAIQPDGKIVVGGYEITDNNDFAVARYNSDGSLDTTFSTDGKFDFTFGATDICQSIALQPDGKIVMAGYTDDLGTDDFAVARLNANGTQDTSFDTDGELTTQFILGDQATSVVIQPDGKILVGGSSSIGLAAFAIARYTPTGALDTSFSGDGKVIQNFVGEDRSTSMVLQKDGKIVMGGYTKAGAGDNDFALARFTPSGVLDPTFGTAGQRIIDVFPSSEDLANAMALQADGRLVLAGTVNSDFAVARLNMLVRSDARVGSKSPAPVGDNIYNLTGAGQTLNPTIKISQGEKKLFVRIQNDGHDTDSFKVKGTKGSSKFKVKYLNGKINVTTAVRAGTFSTGPLAPGGSFLLTAEITTKKGLKPNKKTTLKISGTSNNDPASRDLVTIKGKSK